MSKNGDEFLDIGSCSLHNIHNAFKKGLKELYFDIDPLLLIYTSCSSCIFQEETIMMQGRLPVL